MIDLTICDATSYLSLAKNDSRMPIKIPVTN